MASIHTRLHKSYTSLAAAAADPSLLSEPFNLGEQLGLARERVLAVVQPFVQHALRYFAGETQSWWQPPLAFAQLADPAVEVRKGAAEHWAAVAKGTRAQSEGWDMHGVLTTFLPAVEELGCSGNLRPELHMHLCTLLLHVPVTNAGSETALKVRIQKECMLDGTNAKLISFKLQQNADLNPW